MKLNWALTRKVLLSEAILSHWFQGFLLHKLHFTRSEFIFLIQAILARPLEPCPNPTHLSSGCHGLCMNVKIMKLFIVKNITGKENMKQGNK